MNPLATPTEPQKFDFLAKRALELGASAAKIIPSNQIVIEDRVVLKCRVGCNNYGKTLACPPYTPTPEEFRKMVNEYSYALLIQFTSKVYVDAELHKLLSVMDLSALDKEARAKVDGFWASWKQDKNDMLTSVVTLEKEAMRAGYPLALGFVSGACQLCEKCNTETRICNHPDKARLSEDAVGVNVKATAKNAGIDFGFVYPKKPDSFALLLID